MMWAIYQNIFTMVPFNFTEIHPILNVKKPQEKTHSKKSKPQKSKSSKQEKSRHKDRNKGDDGAGENAGKGRQYY